MGGEDTDQLSAAAQGKKARQGGHCQRDEHDMDTRKPCPSEQRTRRPPRSPTTHRAPGHLLHAGHAVGGRLHGEGEGEQEHPAADEGAQDGHDEAQRACGGGEAAREGIFGFRRVLRCREGPTHARQWRQKVVLLRPASHTAPTPRPNSLGVRGPPGTPATAAFFVSSAMWAEES